MQGEVRELLTRYGKIDLLWFDFDGREAVYDQANTYALVKSARPEIIINNRLDLSTNNNNTEILSSFADYYTPEQQIGAYDDRRPWETCMTLGQQWSWKPHDQIKSPSEVIGILARTAGGDGNLLLNVGPMPDGRIEPRQVEVLHQVGAWMKRNGRSIYGTRGGPFKPADYGSSTRRGDTVYVHLLKWPDGPVRLASLPAKIRSARLLAGGKADVRQTPTGIEISVAPALRDPNDTVVSLKLDGDAMRIPALDVPAQTVAPPPAGK
jgi:alpha-L-fucosidase